MTTLKLKQLDPVKFEKYINLSRRLNKDERYDDSIKIIDSNDGSIYSIYFRSQRNQRGDMLWIIYWFTDIGKAHTIFLKETALFANINNNIIKSFIEQVLKIKPKSKFFQNREQSLRNFNETYSTTLATELDLKLIDGSKTRIILEKFDNRQYYLNPLDQQKIEFYNSLDFNSITNTDLFWIDYVINFNLLKGQNV